MVMVPRGGISPKHTGVSILNPRRKIESLACLAVLHQRGLML